MSADYERLGLFYLGKQFDLDKQTRLDDLVLYDSRDLLTHAVCVGMTGSGKTGLGISLIEEAAIDGIPVLAIDPKGDLGNLLLTFPSLAPADFAAWIDAGEAQRHGATVDAYAAETARRWKDGLAEWNQDGARIARLKADPRKSLRTSRERSSACRKRGPSSQLSTLRFRAKWRRWKPLHRARWRIVALAWKPMA